ncbi:MAG: hypothetical protein DMF65_01050, partial [Acidobacteria bacterium]
MTTHAGRTRAKPWRDVEKGREVGVATAVTVGEGAELVRRCRAGDGAAWEEIVSTYSRRIYNLAYRF